MDKSSHNSSQHSTESDSKRELKAFWEQIERDMRAAAVEEERILRRAQQGSNNNRNTNPRNYMLPKPVKPSSQQSSVRKQLFKVPIEKKSTEKVPVLTKKRTSSSSTFKTHKRDSFSISNNKARPLRSKQECSVKVKISSPPATAPKTLTLHKDEQKENKNPVNPLTSDNICCGDYPSPDSEGEFLLLEQMTQKTADPLKMFSAMSGNLRQLIKEKNDVHKKEIKQKNDAHEKEIKILTEMLTMCVSFMEVDESSNKQTQLTDLRRSVIAKSLQTMDKMKYVQTSHNDTASTSFANFKLNGPVLCTPVSVKKGLLTVPDSAKTTLFKKVQSQSLLLMFTPKK